MGITTVLSYLEHTLKYRLFFIVLHAFIGFALLTNVSFISSWRAVQDLSFSGTGIGPIDSAIALQKPQPNVFWSWFYGLIVSPNYSTTVAAIKCTEGLCYSYFLPGTTYSLHPSSPTPGPEDLATALVINNVTGYQIEFYAPESKKELNNAVCQVYGVESGQTSVAILICLKQSGSDLLAGFSITHGPPLTLALNVCSNRPNCLSDTSWQNNITYYTKVTISRRQATVVYSRANNTIIDIPSVSEQEPTNYDPVTDFFPIYDMAMNVSNPAILDYITSIAEQVLNANQYDAQLLLRQIILVPVGLYNTPSSAKKAAYLGIPAYQVSDLVFPTLKEDHHIIRLALFIYSSGPLVVGVVARPPRSVYAHTTSQFITLSRN